MTRSIRVACILALGTIAACSSADVQGTKRDGGGDRTVFNDPRAAICARSDAGSAVPYATVQQIFDGQCVSCHAAGADLVLEREVSWSNLVNHSAPAAESCGGTLVVPGDSSASYLLQKLASSSPCAGLQMPRGELGSEPLPACVVDLVSSWIQEGAPPPAGDGGP